MAVLGLMHDAAKPSPFTSLKPTAITEASNFTHFYHHLDCSTALVLKPREADVAFPTCETSTCKTEQQDIRRKEYCSSIFLQKS